MTLNISRCYVKCCKFRFGDDSEESDVNTNVVHCGLYHICNSDSDFIGQLHIEQSTDFSLESFGSRHFEFPFNVAHLSEQKC